MLRNYLLIAWRNILKHRIFSALNVFGLALSMSVGLLILLLYQDGYNYDTFHKEAELIYRVNMIATRKNGDIEPYATSPAPIRKVLASKFAWVDKVTALKIANDIILKDNQRFDFRGKTTDTNFLRVFNFSFQRGNAATALQEPNSIVLSAGLSKKLFKDDDPVNKTVQIRNRGLYKITGVLHPNPGKTHFEFDALLSEKSVADTAETWSNLYSTYTYIKVKPNTDIELARSAINNAILPQYKYVPPTSRDAGYQFDLQALPDITPGYSIANAMGKGLPSHLLWFLALMGFIVIISAIFNYTNLTLAKSFNKAKEVGVRKVLGANRSQILLQLVSEGIILALLALVLAVGLVHYFSYELSRLQSFQFFDLDVGITPGSLIYFVVFALLMGAVAGFLPAITISKLDPLTAIHKIENLNLFKRIGLVRTLLVIQFAFTMLFIMIITTVYRQLEFAIHMNYGFSTDHLYTIQLQGVSASLAKEKFATIAGVGRISSINKPIGTYSDSPIPVKTDKRDTYELVSSYSVDNDFIPNLRLSLVAGENFSATPATDTANRAVLVNELFIKKYRLGTASASVGKLIYLNDSTTATIKGVVKDFLFKPADDALAPLLLRNNPSEWRLLNVKILPQNPEKTLIALQEGWKEIAPGYAFRGEFYETTMQNNYTIVKDVNKIISFFTFLSVLIGMMGLLGMTIYSVEKRRKEISLRKIVGATERDIVVTLSKGFVILLLISFGLSIPLGIYISKQILDNFANRIPLGLNIILPGVIILSALAIVTICSQSIKAALTNPAKSLRSE